MKHVKQTLYFKDPDDPETVHIESKSYYEQLSQSVEELEKPVLTSSYTIEQDVIHALGHITKDGAFKLVLTIETKNGEPHRIVKRWMTVKNNYPRI
jgi:hypothetical protein